MNFSLIITNTNIHLKNFTILFLGTGEKGHKKGKRKFIKCFKNRLNRCKQIPLKYIHKYNASPRVSIYIYICIFVYSYEKYFF